MSDPLDDEAYGNWIDAVFPSADPLTLVGVPALVAGVVFAGGYGIAWLGNEPYLQEGYPYVGLGGIFWILLWLGWVDSVLVGVWNEVYPAFDVSTERYREVVGSRLAAFYDDGVTFGYSAVFVLLYVVVTVLFYRPSPGEAAVIGTLVRPEAFSAAEGYSLARVVAQLLFGVVLVPALVTSVRGFLMHVFALRAVARLPFRDIHAAARQLEPLVRFSMTPATAWFAGISLVVLWFHAGISSDVALLTIGALMFVGLLHIGAPLLILHDALEKARQELLEEVRREYAEIRQSIRSAEESADELSLWLEVTDRRQQNAKAVSTWVYDLPSVSRFVAASVIPWWTIIQRALTQMPQ